MRTLILAAALLIVAIPAMGAERPVTDAERARLVAAVSAQGCNGGKMEWDASDSEFEVDDVRCTDGRVYDLKFNADYSFKSKKLEN